MSATFPFNNLEVSRIIEPRVNINKKLGYDFQTGVTSNRFHAQIADSASTSNLVFSYKPSQNVLISRKMYVVYDLYIQFTGTSAPGRRL